MLGELINLYMERLAEKWCTCRISRCEEDVPRDGVGNDVLVTGEEQVLTLG